MKKQLYDISIYYRVSNTVERQDITDSPDDGCYDIYKNMMRFRDITNHKSIWIAIADIIRIDITKKQEEKKEEKNV
jgi:hypothetical protein